MFFNCFLSCEFMTHCLPPHCTYWAPPKKTTDVTNISYVKNDVTNIKFKVVNFCHDLPSLLFSPIFSTAIFKRPYDESYLGERHSQQKTSIFAPIFWRALNSKRASRFKLILSWDWKVMKIFVCVRRYIVASYFTSYDKCN